MRRRFQNNDPRWLEARYAGECSCGKKIAKGDRCAWFPLGRKLYCEACGDGPMRRFEADVFDEAQYAGRW